jgi:DNA-directed RNA polymerase alpha subunit
VIRPLGRSGHVLSGRSQRYETQAREAEPIASFEQLCAMTAQEILERPNAGVETLDEIRVRLAERGLSLKQA